MVQIDLFMFRADSFQDENDIKRNNKNCDFVEVYIGRRLLSPQEQEELSAATNLE